MEEVATAISDEARAKYNEFKTYGETLIYQGLTLWSPNINIFRDPRWGRGHETYGEDPYLTGVLGTAYIRGLQGNGKYYKCDATLKHYAVHSGPEAKRHGFDAVVNQKDLYEIYLWAFQYCIDHAKPAAVMGAYNRVNGEAACASQTLLRDILRGEFGFDGYVVSDCGAINDLHGDHGLTKTAAESTALAIKNGCDLNCGSAYRSMGEALDQGILDEETITRSVERLMETRLRLGMLADDCEYDAIPYDVANEVIEVLTVSAAKKQVEIHLNGESCVMNGIRRYLYEIIYNLCDNAIRYNKDGGKVTVDLKNKDSNIILSVNDTGIGIPAEHQSRIFERFYRVYKSHSKETGGTGLGLSIVKHAVAYHGGKVTLDSKVGKGTTITVVF